MFFLLITTIIVLFLTHKFIEIKRKSAWTNAFSNPPENFLVGHLLKIKNTSGLIYALAKFFKDFNYGTIRINAGTFVVGIATTDIKLIEAISTSTRNLRKSRNYLFLLPWVGRGLITSDGELWKKHRKILTPAFHFEILKNFVPVFESVGNVLVDKLKNINETPSIDLYPLVTLCTLDIICETSMGTKLNAQLDEDSQYVQAVKQMTELVIKRALNPIKFVDELYAYFPDFKTEQKQLEILHNYTENVLTRKFEEKSQRESCKESDKTNDDDGRKTKLAFLDLILQYNDKDQLSFKEIREEVDTFMFAGHDTTASAISFVLFCLANHPEIQEKAWQEQKELFGENKTPSISYQDLQDMKYLELVIKETLRLYPPVPIVGRWLVEDMLFEGKLIPKKANVAIHIYALHRNPKYFPDPDTFNPDRFLTPQSIPTYAYIPFSAGQRNCIGQRFAMLEIKSAVSKIIRNFQLTPAIPHHNLVLAADAVLLSKNGIKVGLKARV